MNLTDYQIPTCFDEMFKGAGEPRDYCVSFANRLASLSDSELYHRQQSAELMLQNMGITFTVYGHEDGTEKVWPFDLLPRIIDGKEWDDVERGLRQRVQALNMFVDDLYNDRRVFHDKIVPEELLHSSKTYRKQMEGFRAPQGAWCHISGVDLIRGGDGQFYVLEDNLRCPSGVSYVLENREVMKRTFANRFSMA